VYLGDIDIFDSGCCGGVWRMKEKEIYQKAVSKFGQLQITKTIEEMAELQKELCKLLLGNGDREHIAEEMADVEIMFGQLKEMFINRLLVTSYKAEKLQRLERLLEVQE
jgi:hypothetical protein